MSCGRTLGVPLEGTRRVGGPLGVAGRLSGTVSPFRAEQGTSLETLWRARASSCQEVVEARSLALQADTLPSEPPEATRSGKPDL